MANWATEILEELVRADVTLAPALAARKVARYVLERGPRLRGILFDLPQVIENARKLVNDATVVDRCEFASGSFFEAVPDGAATPKSSETSFMIGRRIGRLRFS